MNKIEFTERFKRDYGLALNRGCDPTALQEVVAMLAGERRLPERYGDHALSDGDGLRECHIETDWILVYGVRKNILALRFLRADEAGDR